MQRMAELVEQRTCIVKGKQGKLASGSFGEVADIYRDRTYVVAKIFLAAETRAPCS